MVSRLCIKLGHMLVIFHWVHHARIVRREEYGELTQVYALIYGAILARNLITNITS